MHDGFGVTRAMGIAELVSQAIANMWNPLGMLEVIPVSKRRFILRCDVLGWHTPSSEVGFDGLSFSSLCARCGRRIMLDSQGNWFGVRGDSRET